MYLKSIIKFSSFLLAIFLLHCGGSSSTTTTTTTTASAVSSTVPSDVVISSPTAVATTTTTSISAAMSPRAFALAGDPENDQYEAKKEALQELITGEGECAFTLTIGDPNRPACYGPSVDYQGHPSGGGSGQLPGGDVGIWSKNENVEGSEQACAAAQANYLVESVANRVDSMISMVGSAACAGKKADITLPATDDAVIDLKTNLEEFVDVEGLTFNTATLDRLADVDGNAQYQTKINATIDTGDGKVATGEITVTHIPLDSTNTTYKGKMSMLFDDANVNSFNCGEEFASEGTTFAGTILYNKSSETNVVYEMNYAQFCGSGVDPFDENDNIDPADKVSASNPDGWGDDWNYALFSLDPTNGTGTVEYAWQAGRNDNATRVLNITTAEAADGSATGEAWYGFGPDVTSEDIGTIDGFICNWAGPGQIKGVGNVIPDPLVQFQSLTRASGETLFTAIDAENAILYAPTNDCNYPGGGFKYTSSIESSSNDNTTGAAIVHELLDLTDYDTNFTPLTRPDDI